MRFRDGTNLRAQFVRMAVVPMALLLVIGTISSRWLHAGRVPGFTIRECQGLTLRGGGPPADVLLIGSSRLGLAVDDEAVTRNLSGGLTAEKVTIVSSLESQQSHALREYISSRGAPKVLGIEVSIDKKDGAGSDPTLQFKPTTWTTAAVRWRTHLDFFRAALKSELFGWSDVFLRSTVENPVAAGLARIQMGFSRGIRSRQRVIETELGCNEHYFRMFSNGWAEPMPADHDLPSEGKLADIRESAFRAADAEIDSSRADGEFAILGEMVDYALGAGVQKVFLMYFPDFEEHPDVMPADTILERVAGVTLFDVRDVFAASDVRVGLQYLDWRHLNVYGGWVVSRELGEFVSKLDVGE